MNVVALLGGVRASIFAGLAVLALLFGGVQTARLAYTDHKLEVQTLALKANAADFAEWKLKAEREKAEAVAGIAKKYLEDRQRDKATSDRIIAGLRNDTLQLRKRFTCEAPRHGGATSPDSSGAGAEGTGGLTKDDAEFLIRFAEDSDRKSRKINALIDVLEEYRKLTE